MNSVRLCNALSQYRPLNPSDAKVLDECAPFIAAARALITNDNTSMGDLRAFERRSKARFAIDQEVRYCGLSDRQPVKSGSGRTKNVSSGGIFFTTETALAEGAILEVSMRWPALLRDSCPMKLYIQGHVVRRESGGVAVAIRRHEFRTLGKSFD